jgi:hypothetical protein
MSASLAGRALLAGLALTTSGLALARDEAPSPDGGGEQRAAVQRAGPQHRAGAVHRFIFGRDYRDLWTQPTRVDVLDLATFAGGLTPVRRIGAGQSRNLALRGGDGRAYTFRALEKDATRGLPEELRDTIAGDIAQDQLSALHPAADAVAGELLRAVGVLHVDSRLVVLPDGARLGEFRSEFAGALGTIQEYPRADGAGGTGFAGATELVESRELLRRLRRSSDERVDARAYLRARLMDLFVGDWDRHLGQWKWARLGGRSDWQPIPEDRDFAFSRYEGLALAVARNWYPRWVKFGDDYPSMLGLTWQAWPLDRTLLTGLERAAWDELAAELQARLTDEVIDRAVRQLPDEYEAVDGPRLAQALRSRRDRLRAAADRFYLHLAGEVGVEGTDEGDVAEAIALEGGGLEVTLRRAGAAGEPWFRRRFLARETREIRIELRGGDDRFVSRGRSAIRVRVIGGEGDDVLDDSAGGGAHLADWQGNLRLLRGPGTRVDTRAYAPPPLEKEAPYLPARDWGRQRTILPWFSVGPDVGLFAGGGVRLERFAFRTYPYRSRHVLLGGYATGAGGFRADYHGDLRLENSTLAFAVDARASQIEIIRFFGLGNETPSPVRDEYFEVRQTQLSLAPSMVVPLPSGLSLSVGASLERFRTSLPRDRFISLARPYGSEPFRQLGASAELRLDTRDVPTAAQRGFLLVAGGSIHPAVWEVREPYAEAHAEAATHLTARVPTRPTLSLRLGGRRLSGSFPFMEAAFIGGAETVRGYAPQRYAGAASAWGNAELRLTLGRYRLVFPGQYGAFAFADSGRVWAPGERSQRWHTGAGGGLWFAYLERRNAVTLAVARSAERTALYVQMGFAF